MRRRLPIRIESPCEERWSAMTPASEGRHCARCATTVVDLTRATRREAEQILRAHGGSVCGRVRADENGVAVFRAEPQRGRAALALAGLLAACSTEPAAESPTAPVAVAPDDASQADARVVPIGAGTSGSFGGSLATGVMMPVADEPPPVATSPAPVVETPDEPEGVPTPEQRELTRRKHERRTHPFTPPSTRPVMGLMSIGD